MELYKKGFFHIFLGSILNKLFAFISSVIIVRLISKTDYASLTYTDNIYSYVTLFAGFGMSSAILKYCSSDNQKKNKAYFKIALKYGSIVQIGIVLIVLLYISIIDIPFSGAKELILIYCFYPIIEYLLSVIYNIVRSLLKNKLYATMSVIQTSIVMTLGIIFVLGTGTKGILIARYIAVVIVVSLGAFFVKKEFKNVEDIKLEKSEIKSFMIMAISLLIANIFSMIMPLNETFLINNLIRDEAITANYKVAVMLPSQLSFITSSIITYYFPIIARMKNKSIIWKNSVKIGRITSIILLGISIIGIGFSKIIILFIYGEKYLDAIGISKIFWIVYFFNAGFRMIPMNILPAIGKTKFNAFMAIISCIIHFYLDYFMISNYGISGVAVATSVVYMLSGIGYWIYLYICCKRENI